MKRLFLLLPLVIPAAGSDVTYHRDIAPIVYQNCMSCHREGESAPFSLTNYEEVSRKARTIRRATEDRYMPPWHANPDETEFLDVRRLTAEQISLIDAWIKAGKPEGDPADAPERPVFEKGWQLGVPDLIVTMPLPANVPAEGPDIYRNFTIPLDLAEDKWVKAVELRPSARAVVHHSLIFLDDSGKAREMEGKDGSPGFSGMGFKKSGSLGGYVPGVSPRKLPGDLARPLKAGSDIVLATHFHPSGKTETEQTTLGIYFADTPPARELTEIQVPPSFGRKAGIDIAAGESDFSISDTFTLPVDAEAICVSGHAHYICESMRMTAKLPDGTETILLDIPDWDLDWQDTYFFAKPTILPAGTILESVIRYDNSSTNLDNPFTPPRRIKWGRESTDEMGSITLTAVPVDAGDATQFSRSSKAQQIRVIADVAKELRESKIHERLPAVIESLDANGNGSLEESELPERMKGPLLMRLDADGNKALDANELAKLKSWLAKREA